MSGLCAFTNQEDDVDDNGSKVDDEFTSKPAIIKNLIHLICFQINDTQLVDFHPSRADPSYSSRKFPPRHRDKIDHHKVVNFLKSHENRQRVLHTVNQPSTPSININHKIQKKTRGRGHGTQEIHFSIKHD